MSYYKPYRNRGYYKRRNNNPDLLEMIFEIIWILGTLIGTGIIKLSSYFFRNRKNLKGLFKINENPIEVLENNPQTIDNTQTTYTDGIEWLPENPSAVIEKNVGRYSLKNSLLTETEQNFLIVLKQIVGDRYKIESQVQLSSLVTPSDSNSHYTNYADFNKIKAKSVDFVLYNDKYKPFLVIELDDRSHFRWKRIQRDQFVNDLMEEVGLRIIHIPVSYSYDPEDLKEQIFLIK